LRGLIGSRLARGSRHGVGHGPAGRWARAAAPPAVSARV